jgi:hypothetical protein
VNRYLYRGDLSETPLPEILVTIHHYKAPGVITCIRDDERKEIFVESGRVIFATSSSVYDSLGNRLLAAGRISRDQYEESLRRLSHGGKRQGVILVELGALEPRDLFVGVRDQVQEIVWSIFEWKSGTVTFEPGRDRAGEFIKLNLSIPQAVLQGARRIVDAKALLARVGGKGTILERAADADFSEIALAPEEQAILNSIDGKRPLGELVMIANATPAINARIIYALHTLRLVNPRPPGIIKVQVAVRSPGD